jgi:hypothetical protein
VLSQELELERPIVEIGSGSAGSTGRDGERDHEQARKLRQSQCHGATSGS